MADWLKAGRRWYNPEHLSEVELVSEEPLKLRVFKVTGGLATAFEVEGEEAVAVLSELGSAVPQKLLEKEPAKEEEPPAPGHQEPAKKAEHSAPEPPTPGPRRR